MSKKVFLIEKTETYMAGMSTRVTINLNENGKGTAKIEWKRGEPQIFDVEKGQRIFLDMWGGIPKVAIWNPPIPPKDSIRKFLWEQGITKKKIWVWEDPNFKNEVYRDIISFMYDETFTLEVGVLKIHVYARRWQSCMTGNWKTEDWEIIGLAIKDGATLQEVQTSWNEIQQDCKPTLIECPGLH